MDKVCAIGVVYSADEVDGLSTRYALSAPVIIVNNGGCPEPKNAPVSWTFIRSDGNVGLPKAKNAALCLALKKFPAVEYFFFFSPDVSFNDDSVFHLIDLANRDEKIACVGWHRCVFGGSKEQMRVIGDYGECVECGDAILLVKRQAFDSIGRFDERFFLHGFDIDWCRRAHGMGWDIVVSMSDNLFRFRTDDAAPKSVWCQEKIRRDNFMLDEQYFGAWHNWRMEFAPYPPSCGGIIRHDVFQEKWRIIR
jgi:hypothetical protein